MAKLSVMLYKLFISQVFTAIHSDPANVPRAHLKYSSVQISANKISHEKNKREKQK